MPIDPKTLADWARITEAATPGPWRKGTTTSNDDLVCAIGPYHEFTPGFKASENAADAWAGADATFIALARTAMLLLIEEVKRLQAGNPDFADYLQATVDRDRAIAERDAAWAEVEFQHAYGRHYMELSDTKAAEVNELRARAETAEKRVKHLEQEVTQLHVDYKSVFAAMAERGKRIATLESVLRRCVGWIDGEGDIGPLGNELLAAARAALGGGAVTDDDIVRELQDWLDRRYPHAAEDVAEALHRAIAAGREQARDELVLELSKMQPGKTFTAVRTTIYRADEIHGATSERAAIVVWLRDTSLEKLEWTGGEIRDLVGDIECGKHLEKKNE